MSHTCDAFVLACIDFRFHHALAEPLKKMQIFSYDLKCDAGAAKYLVSAEKPAVRDWIFENIEIASRLHHVKKVVLVNHYDCGAYGGNQTWQNDAAQLAFQTEQLQKAKRQVAEKFPHLQVIAVFAKPTADGLEFVEV
jgi:carbonic anhydrase